MNILAKKMLLYDNCQASIIWSCNISKYYNNARTKGFYLFSRFRKMHKTIIFMHNEIAKLWIMDIDTQLLVLCTYTLRQKCLILRAVYMCQCLTTLSRAGRRYPWWQAVNAIWQAGGRLCRRRVWGQSRGFKPGAVQNEFWMFLAS